MHEIMENDWKFYRDDKMTIKLHKNNAKKCFNIFLFRGSNFFAGYLVDNDRSLM